MRGVPPRGPRRQGRPRRRRRRQRAATSGSSPTATSPRCSPSATTRTAGPATATHGSGKKRHGAAAAPTRSCPCPRAPSSATTRTAPSSPTSCTRRPVAGGRGRAGRPGQRPVPVEPPAGAGVRRAGRGGRGALAAARAQAARRRRPGRVPQRRQVDADRAPSRRPSRRSPTTRSPRSSRTSASCGSTTREFVVADIPGLIEGAAEGRGLGHQFLRHVERARALCVLVDLAWEAAGLPPPAEQERVLLAELGAYQPELLDRPRIVAGSRLDLADRRRRRRRRRAGPAVLGGHRRGRPRRSSARWPAPCGRCGPPSRSPTAFVVHRPVPQRGRRGRARRSTAPGGSSGAPPSGPSPCRTSRTPTPSSTPSRACGRSGSTRRSSRPAPAAARWCGSGRFEFEYRPDDEWSLRRGRRRGIERR